MALLEARKKQLAAEGLFAAERKTAALFARNHRRGDQPVGRGHPRYSAPAGRPVSAPCAGLAGTRAGRNLRRGSGARHCRLQCAARRMAKSRGPMC